MCVNVLYIYNIYNFINKNFVPYDSMEFYLTTLLLWGPCLSFFNNYIDLPCSFPVGDPAIFFNCPLYILYILLFPSEAKIPMPLLCLWSLYTLHSWLISLQHVVQVTSKIVQIIDIALGCITVLESWSLLLKILRILYYDDLCLILPESISPVVEPSWYKKTICKLLRREKQLNTPTQLQYLWTTTMIIMKIYNYIYIVEVGLSWDSSCQQITAGK